MSKSDPFSDSFGPAAARDYNDNWTLSQNRK